MLNNGLCWQDKSHHKVAILLFHGDDLISLITFVVTILYQAVSCFSVETFTAGISKCYESIL